MDNLTVQMGLGCFFSEGHNIDLPLWLTAKRRVSFLNILRLGDYIR